MLTKALTLISLLFSLFVWSCHQETTNFENKKQALKDSLYNFYKNDQDSLKREAVTFLLGNMDETQKVTYPFFYSKKNNRPVSFDLLKVAGKKDFEFLVDRQNIGYKDTTVYDVEVLNAIFLKDQIDKAFRDWKEYPWNKKIGKQIFFNYLLPYKVFNDKPVPWRKLLFEKFYLDLLQLKGRYRNSNPEDIVSKYRDMPNSLLKYQESYFKISNSNHFNEIIAIGEGDCITEALLNVYIFRSMGLSSTMDMIPLLGKRNGRHFETVYCDSTGNMVPLTLKSDMDQKSKVFRYIYESQKKWNDTIKPTIINSQDFLLKHLMNNHWIDVTSSYNQVADVTFQLDRKYPEHYGYICVYNYGRWEPVFWGKKVNDKLFFSNMGTDIIYRIAVPVAGNLKFITNPFILAKNGKLEFQNYRGQNYDILTLDKVNSGREATVKQDSTYTLSYLDHTANWVNIMEKKAPKTSIDLNSTAIKEKIKQYISYEFTQAAAIKQITSQIKGSIEFKNVPKNVFLKLQEKGDKKNLARIFLIDSLTKNQVWY